MTAPSRTRTGGGWIWQQRNRHAIAKFAEFWLALQEVGDALAEAQKATKVAEAGGWTQRNQRHWNVAGFDEVRTALRGCKFSLRVVVAQAKRFEPQLIAKDWRR